VNVPSGDKASVALDVPLVPAEPGTRVLGPPAAVVQVGGRLRASALTTTRPVPPKSAALAVRDQPVEPAR
jgi:hypothetical protein